MRSKWTLCTRRLWIGGAAVAVVLALAGPARADLMIGGTVTIVEGVVVIPGIEGLGYAIHDSGFGSGDFTSGAIPTALPALDLSQSFSNAGGTSSSSVGLLASGGGSSLDVLASPSTISLSQEDLSSDPNGSAVLELILAIPFTYASANPTETVSFAMGFDVDSNLSALSGSDGLTVQSCVAQGSQLIAGSGSGFASDCNAQGGTPATQVSLTGTSLPTSASFGFDEDVATNVQHIANFTLRFQITNDTGPTTLSVDDFTLSVAEAPEPGAALLAVVGLAAGAALHRRR